MLISINIIALCSCPRVCVCVHSSIALGHSTHNIQTVCVCVCVREIESEEEGVIDTGFAE